MNQILSVSNNQDKKKYSGSQKDINSIVRFLAIILIIFGVFVIGSGSYAIYKNSNNVESATTKPTILVENKSEDTILLKVMHDKEISEIFYNWNDKENNKIDGKQRKYVEQEIKAPLGTNVLNVIAKDINGQEINYKKEYRVETGININLQLEGNNIKLSVEGQNNLSYVTYKWDEGEEVKKDINGNKFDTEIEIPKGEHLLTIVAVDIENNTETKEQKVKGVTKPKVNVTIEGENYLITASDEEGLKKVAFKTEDGKSYFINLDNGEKEFVYRFPLKQGDNRIEVTVYNINDITAEKKVRCTI